MKPHIYADQKMFQSQISFLNISKKQIHSTLHKETKIIILLKIYKIHYFDVDYFATIY